MVFYFVVKVGYLNVVKFLIESGVFLKFEIKEGKVFICFVVVVNYFDVLSFLMKCDYNMNYLMDDKKVGILFDILFEFFFFFKVYIIMFYLMVLMGVKWM